MKTYRIETEDRYGRFNDYDLQAESLEAATLIAEKRVNLPNGAFVMDVKKVEKSAWLLEIFQVYFTYWEWEKQQKKLKRIWKKHNSSNGLATKS